VFVGVATLFALGNFTYMFFILRVQQFFTLKLAVVMPLLLYMLFNVVYAIFAIPAGLLADRFGKGRILALGYLLFGLSSLGFVVFDSLPWFIFLFSLYGLFQAVVDGNQRAFASDLVDEGIRGTALGTFHTATGLAAMPAGLIGGALWQINPQVTFIYGAFMGFLASILLLILWSFSKR
jgi:MFS family permease